MIKSNIDNIYNNFMLINCQRRLYVFKAYLKHFIVVLEKIISNKNERMNQTLPTPNVLKVSMLWKINFEVMI